MSLNYELKFTIDSRYIVQNKIKIKNGYNISVNNTKNNALLRINSYTWISFISWDITFEQRNIDST